MRDDGDRRQICQMVGGEVGGDLGKAVMAGIDQKDALAGLHAGDEISEVRHLEIDEHRLRRRIATRRMHLGDQIGRALARVPAGERVEKLAKTLRIRLLQKNWGTLEWSRGQLPVTRVSTLHTSPFDLVALRSSQRRL